MKILVTGAAGFIGSQLTNRLRNSGHNARGLDNYNNHLYEPDLKRDRVEHFELDISECDLRDRDGLRIVLGDFEPEIIVHLAAHAGVRDSFGKESEYHANNIDGTQNLIEVCKEVVPNVRVIYASTSGVFGGTEIPEDGWKENQILGKQLNAYTYTKYINEIQFEISGLNNTGLRFFTVYGPWGRPDMALFDFTKNILDKNEIKVYNYGNMKRDFTYVEDILDGIEIVIHNNEIANSEIFNIGRGKQVDLMHFVREIEKNCGIEAIIDLAPRHPADSLETWSNTTKLEELGYVPKTNIEDGISNFYAWYKDYHKVK
jgi:UDP-glucuronate 4-epimerase|tara:strand:- start:3696 stop:4643 length:948 start_codon:yes stop_codon:yes gene_type:complete